VPPRKLCASCVHGNPGYYMVSLDDAMSGYGIENMEEHLSWLPTIPGKSVREWSHWQLRNPGPLIVTRPWSNLRLSGQWRGCTGRVSQGMETIQQST
jgi:hypothetical protein